MHCTVGPYSSVPRTKARPARGARASTRDIFEIRTAISSISLPWDRRGLQRELEIRRDPSLGISSAQLSDVVDLADQCRSAPARSSTTGSVFSAHAAVSREWE